VRPTTRAHLAQYLDEDDLAAVERAAAEIRAEHVERLARELAAASGGSSDDHRTAAEAAYARKSS
jgi:hypothetical protein